MKEINIMIDQEEKSLNVISLSPDKIYYKEKLEDYNYNVNSLINKYYIFR